MFRIVGGAGDSRQVPLRRRPAETPWVWQLGFTVSATWSQSASSVTRGFGVTPTWQTTTRLHSGGGPSPRLYRGEDRSVADGGRVISRLGWAAGEPPRQLGVLRVPPPCFIGSRSCATGIRCRAFLLSGGGVGTRASGDVRTGAPHPAAMACRRQTDVRAERCRQRAAVWRGLSGGVCAADAVTVS